MRKIANLLVCMILVTLCASNFFITISRAEKTIIYVDDDNTIGPWDGRLGHPYQHIQDGIDNATSGDTVFVLEGTYTESLIHNDSYVYINKSIDLVGKNQDTTIINCPYPGYSDYFGVFIQGNIHSINIIGFKINGDENLLGIGMYIYQQHDPLRIENCTAHSFLRGIWLRETDHSLLKQCTTYHNNGTDGEYGSGIYITDGANDVITECDSYFNSYGIYLENTQSCTMYHNNFYNNTVNASDNALDNTINTWYNTTVLEGNYYGDYTGEDTNGDGIGDTSYNISGGSSQDFYPLIYHFMNTHTITASAGSGGIIIPSGAVIVPHGTYKNFTITPDTGYHIVTVLVDGGSVGVRSWYNFSNVIANHTISASFAINQYTITASAGSGGSISPSGNVSVNYGGYKNFTITLDTGYHILDVLVDSESVGAVNWHNFTNVIANHTISASFAQTIHTITASAGAGGSIAPSGAVIVAHGGYKNFTITPDTGYHILDIQIDSSSVGPVTYYNFTNVITNHTISVIFEIIAPVNNPPTVTNPSPTNGSIGVLISLSLLSITIQDPEGDHFNWTITTSPNVGSNSGTNATNGTKICIIANLAYSKTYTWYVTAYDGVYWTNKTYWFITTSGGGAPPGPEPPSGPQNIKPVANTSAGEPYQGLVNSEITFDGSKSYDPDGNITKWFWVFGDNTNSTGKTVSHTYSKVGTYNVTLTVTDNNGATNTDTTTCVITQRNKPPTKPIIQGTKNGPKNTIYTYTALSTDADNDTIQYTFNWGDAIFQSSGFLRNGTSFTANHSWAAAGRYGVTVTVTDNQTESSSNLTVYIDALQINGVGYLLDNDGDGIYDAFYSDVLKQTTTIQKKDSNYNIDSDGDGDWDYTFDATRGLITPYQGLSTTSGFEIIVIIGAIALVMFWKRKRRDRE